MVGAVIAYNGKIIGEGFTSPFGGAHAEVRAIDTVKDPVLLKDATLYVTLEPCCHHGKTPPCTDLILKSKIPRVVIGTVDPHEKVAGKGIAKLRENGRKVIAGVMEEECREHHRRFFTFHQNKRPYVILKWAQSSDGFMAPQDEMRAARPEPYWISGPVSRQLAHKWRSQEQAILVGARTALSDNPSLNTRLWEGSDPLRILIDPELKVPTDYQIFKEGTDTLVFCSPDKIPKGKEHLKYRGLNFGENSVPKLLEALWEENILSLIVEGGAYTLTQFITLGLWDEARIITADLSFQQGLKAPVLSGKCIKEFSAGSDRIKILRNA